MTNVRCRAMGVLAAMAILLASCSSSPPTSAPSSSPATPATSARSSTAAPAATAPTFPPSQTAIEPGRYRWDGFESPVSLEVGPDLGHPELTPLISTVPGVPPTRPRPAIGRPNQR